MDDRVGSLEVRRAMLTQMGYDVLIASDPPSALSIFDKVDVDLVLLDYSFPGQISGDELAHQLRARKPELPLIMLSGFPDLPDNVAQSVDVVLLKGSSQPADLMNAIARLLRGSPYQSPAGATLETPLLLERNQQLRNRSKELRGRLNSKTSGDES
ncbi:MAG: response regulator [Candidatus Korobacteraceae bacterium]